MKSGLLPALVFFSIFSQAQVIAVPMTGSAWFFDSSRVEFITHRGVPAAVPKNGSSYSIGLKNQRFSNGSIEFDVELTGQGFPGINFRMSADGKTGDNFYIRSFGPVTKDIRWTLQYAAIAGGVDLWDLSDEYQAGCTIYQQGKWNHVKLVISGAQMLAYVNDMKTPAMTVPRLEGGEATGSISLNGNVIYANLVLKPNATEGLNPAPGYIAALNDSRYLRNWMLGPEKKFPFGQDLRFPLPSQHGLLNASDLPDSTASWREIKAEPRGIVNVSRVYGAADSDARRLTWLKTTIESDKDQEKAIHFGFSDEVWVFVNGQLVYTEKNYFGTPSQKEPDSWCTIENSSFRLPLKKGKNEVLVALANYFYGWAIVGRLQDTDGIRLP